MSDQSVRGDEATGARRSIADNGATTQQLQTLCTVPTAAAMARCLPALRLFPFATGLKTPPKTSNLKPFISQSINITNILFQCICGHACCLSDHALGGIEWLRIWLAERDGDRAALHCSGGVASVCVAAGMDAAAHNACSARAACSCSLSSAYSPPPRRHSAALSCAHSNPIAMAKAPDFSKGPGGLGADREETERRRTRGTSQCNSLPLTLTLTIRRLCLALCALSAAAVAVCSGHHRR